MSVHDLYWTILNLLSLDHTKLTYGSNGRDTRLTEVYVELIPQIASWTTATIPVVVAGASARLPLPH